MTHKPPLSGVRVLDLTRLLPGPVCTQHLGDLGADVIKIEDTEIGDYAPPALRALVNRNKRALRLDLKHPDGRRAFMRLVRSAHVVVEGFRPGVVKRLGIDYPRLARENPALVFCSISGYGQSGPLSELGGHDLNYCSYAGVADQNGYDASSPALSNLPVADLMGGSLTAAMGILAALVDANRSGRGRAIDISMSDGVLAHAVMPLATLLAHGSTRRAGADTLSGGLPCYTLYRTSDARFVAVAALEPKFWHRFCDTLGKSHLKPLHRDIDADTAARVRNELTEMFAAQPLSEWIARFDGVDCCVSPVLRLEEALSHEQFVSRGMVLETKHPHYGKVTQIACPVKMSDFSFRLDRHAPLPGEHSHEVLAEAGFGENEIADLAESGAVR